MKLAGDFWVHIYKTQVVVINPVTDNELIAYNLRYGVKIKPDPRFAGRAGYIEGEFYWLAIAEKWKDTTQQLADLSHEANHIAEAILFDRGQGHTQESREAYCHLQASIFHRSLALLRNEKL